MSSEPSSQLSPEESLFLDSFSKSSLQKKIFEQNCTKPLKKIMLCIGGGALRGVISAVWLRKIDQGLKQRIGKGIECFDVISGVSAGSILAAAMTLPKPFNLDEIIDLYFKFGQKVFPPKGKINRTFHRFYHGAIYDLNILIELLNEHFGDTRLEECPKLVMTIWNMHMRRFDQNMSGVIFPNYLNPNSYQIYKDFHGMRVADLVAGSCAAPTYFHSHRFKHQNKYFRFRDGGVMDNSSLLGSVAAQCCHIDNPNITLDQLGIISVGTGSPYYFESAVTENQKRSKSATTIEGLVTSITQGGASLATELLTSILLPSRFLSINHICSPEIEMDDSSSIELLKESAEQFDFEATGTLDKIIQMITARDKSTTQYHPRDSLFKTTYLDRDVQPEHQ